MIDLKFLKHQVDFYAEYGYEDFGSILNMLTLSAGNNPGFAMVAVDIMMTIEKAFDKLG